jgi:hypothetical protein
MKRLIVIFLLNLPTPVVAQTVYACQYTDSTGFVFQNERWQTTEFKLREPFFLRLGTDEVPDAAGLKAIEFSPTSTSCRSAGSLLLCSGIDGSSLVFNRKTGSGAMSSIFGASMTGLNRDTPNIFLFRCRKM